jgi:hypothetical protein
MAEAVELGGVLMAVCVVQAVMAKAAEHLAIAITGCVQQPKSKQCAGYRL